MTVKPVFDPESRAIGLLVLSSLLLVVRAHGRLVQGGRPTDSLAALAPVCVDDATILLDAVARKLVDADELRDGS